MPYNDLYIGESDSEIWNQLKNGNEESLREIYNCHVEELYNYGCRISRDKILVEDTIQDLFVALWEKRKNLGDVKRIKPYLFKSLKRRLLRNISKNTFFSPLETSSNYQYDFNLSLSHETILIKEEWRKERILKIKKAINSLTPRQKEAILLKYHHKLSFNEVSEVMGVEIKATYKLIGRAMDTLRNQSELKTLTTLSFFFQFL